ncbi:MAG: mannose-6-phosphate isomerase-like protein (cupin superfamily) [Lysobacterales bacterium]|jgi:mannose-6-phosphate isomerase-like protein (cupin superfamily)
MAKVRQLQGGCFVIDQPDLDLRKSGNISWAQVIGNGDLSHALSLFYLEAGPGKSPAINAALNEAVLYLQEGKCEISICDRQFAVEAGSGVHVRPGESFSFHNQGKENTRWVVSVCPRVEALDFNIEETSFNDKYPHRIVSGADRQMQATSDRFYKLLIGPTVGSEAVTQFIGRIPLSKAPEHFHLYEEAICILSGHGRMWAGDSSTDIRPGSMIFLPKKQPHCLECLDENGMELMGVFYPAGSPEINYAT